jgi:hypothetical protein
MGPQGLQGDVGATGIAGVSAPGQDIFFELTASATLATRSFIGGLLPLGVILADGTGTRIYPAGPAIAVDPALISATPTDDLIIEGIDPTSISPAAGIIGTMSSGTVAPKANAGRTQASIEGFQTMETSKAVVYLKLF